MPKETFAQFINSMKETLNMVDKNCLKENDGYIDLSNIITVDNLTKAIETEITPENPLAEAFELIIAKVERKQLDKVQLGINEFLKNYLLNLTEENDKYITKLYLRRIHMVFECCLSRDFPYKEEIWTYIGGCLNTLGLHLIEQGYLEASKEILETLFQLGRLAAQKGLQTSSTQGYFRVLEHKANEKKYHDLASAAKNFRFNIE